MKRHTPRKRRQGGFTLVEMSVTMAAAGLLFAAVTTGQELVDQAKATKLINDVKALEANIQRFAQIKGRLPGDCNADGEIDYVASANVAGVAPDPGADPPVVGVTGRSPRTDAGNQDRAQEYSYSVLLPVIPGDGVKATAQENACAAWNNGVTAIVADTTNANVWINDLKTAGVISDSVPNRKYAKLVHEDFAFVGSVTDAGAESANGANYNAIVIHNVPQWMARRLSSAINGQDGRADRSRVRQLVRATSTTGEYTPRWQFIGADATAAASMRDAMVTVVYFFDRVPESKKESDAV